jgi:hypothetical protein
MMNEEDDYERLQKIIQRRLLFLERLQDWLNHMPTAERAAQCIGDNEEPELQ